MKIIDKNIAEQTRGIFRKESPTPSDGQANEWRDIPRELGARQVLSDAEILELSALVVKIEKHYGFPVDIEWAREACPNAEGGRGGKFYIVQSRPITTLTVPTGLESLSVKLSLHQTREHSLFYCFVWAHNNHSDMGRLVPGSNINNLVFVRKEGNLTDVYYDLQELAALNAYIEEQLKGDTALFDRIEKDYWSTWNKLELVVNGYQKLRTAEDFQHFFDAWMSWWTPMAFSFVLPNVIGVSEHIRNRALLLRKHSDTISDKIDAVFVNNFTNAFPDYANFAYNVTPEEVERIALKRLLEVELEQIKYRSEGCAIVNNVLIPLASLPGTLEERHLVLEVTQVSSAENELQGQVAYKGKTQGNVRLVRKKSEIRSVLEGEILVTHMTGPDFVAAMKKAAAVVTDEGGVTCHAAIVAREMGKPCIIGTKIATQVLHDGDLVEVDAERGIVTVLERANTEQRTDSSGIAPDKAESRTEQGSGAAAEQGVVTALERAQQ